MADDLILELDSGQDEELEFVAPVITDYDKLQNRPRINGVVLTGNKLFNDLFPGGFIIDGGNAEGAG